jgi:hypothetical protein
METDSYFCSKTAKALSMTRHEELTDGICNIMNQDWLQYPQLHYCTSQFLTGAILVEGGMAILLNTIEPYARDTLLDAQHEKRVSNSPSSLPSISGHYVCFQICLLSTTDGQKLNLETTQWE